MSIFPGFYRNGKMESFTEASSSRFPIFAAHNCKITNNTGQTIYCHIIDDPNRQLVNKIITGLNGGITSAGVNAEFDLDKSVQITQSTRLLHGEDVTVTLSHPKVRYLTMAWKDQSSGVFWLRCISLELRRGHTYIFDAKDLNDPIGTVKDFVGK
jgi:hypothetical protein